MHAADTVADGAQDDLTTVFAAASARPADRAVPVDLNTTLTPGVYDSGTMLLTGALTLDAGGDADAVFLIRLASTLDTGAGSTVALAGGTQACTVFWQVGSAATPRRGRAVGR